jgi:hypothetical protein
MKNCENNEQPRKQASSSISTPEGMQGLQIDDRDEQRENARASMRETFGTDSKMTCVKFMDVSNNHARDLRRSME